MVIDSQTTGYTIHRHIVGAYEPDFQWQNGSAITRRISTLFTEVTATEVETDAYLSTARAYCD
ncbi:hypothetical protein GCM10022202_36040 [Microbacterium marinilacus]|uniref:Uncharacterized protein n=1 Tax=Microbacterium marinilacus TaxID=415209 RepID=A0ABP7BV26_9MICO